MQEYAVDRMKVRVYPTRPDMGRAAALDGAARLKALLLEKDVISVVFAAAPSQNEMMDALLGEPGIAWDRVRAFHMDNYVGLPMDAPQQFTTFLDEKLFSKLPFREVFRMGNKPEDAAVYARILQQYPVDLCFLGIGENGHIAFNDPAVADFDDPETVKVVALDDVCRNQQVHDGCFDSLEKVPAHALTMTIPALVRARQMICTVPGRNKAFAVREMLTREPSSALPATALRMHADAVLYIDRDAASLWEAAQ